MATKYGKTFAGLKGRLFGGKHYRYLTLTNTKAEEKQIADQVRRSGGLARVTKETSELGKTFYIVWSRR